MALLCPKNWPIFRFSFLEDYFEDPDFALNQQHQSLELSDTTDRLERTRKKIYGKSKGLLEIRPTEMENALTKRQTFRDTIKFTHRSILEFLESEQVKEKMAVQLAKFDAFDALCQTFLAHMRVVSMDERYFLKDVETTTYRGELCVTPFPSLDWDICDVLEAYIMRAESPDSFRFCAFLDTVIEAIKSIKGMELSPESTSLTHGDVNIGGFLTKREIPANLQEKIVMMAAFHGVSDYLVHARQNHLAHVTNHLPMLSLASVQVIHDGARHPKVLLGITKVLEFYFEQGRSPNEESFLEGVSCWHYVIWRIVDENLRCRRFSFPLFPFFLLMGGDPRFWVTFGQKSASVANIMVGFEFGNERNLVALANDRVQVTELTRQLEAYIQRNGPEISLKKLVGLWFPQSAKALQDVIDWMLERGGEITADQRRELKEIFGPTLRPLITLEAAERISINPRDYELPELSINFEGLSDFI
jgi:hypothetical protein